MIDRLFSRTHKVPDAAEPYSQLAEIYDYVMRHVDYGFWADYLESIFTTYQKTPATLLELACGTGNLGLYLAKRGYRLTGVDRSRAMVEVAKQKAKQTRFQIDFVQGDMASPPVEGQFDAVLCLYDSMNYIMDLNRMRQVMLAVRARLAPGGLFVFDACTEMNSRRYFHRQTEKEGTGTFAYVRRSEYLAQERIQVNEFKLVFKHGGKYSEHVERHEQRIYPIADILVTCGAAGFEILGVFDGFSFDAASEESNRVHFVLTASPPRDDSPEKRLTS